MMYDIPFDIPEDTDSEYINTLAEKNNLEYSMAGRLYGKADDLINFFREIDGPGQSFPITEFMEFLADHRVV